MCTCEKFQNIFKKRLTYTYDYVIIYTYLRKGGNKMADKKKSNKEILISALLDFVIGLLLLIIDKIID